MKVRSVDDGMEGFLTVRGNKGTSFVDISDTTYVCRRPVPIEINFASGSKARRQLEVGELFDVVEGPKRESKIGPRRAKGRVQDADGILEGWFDVKETDTVPWTRRYRCRQGVDLNEAPTSSSKLVRKLDVGETFEALDLPFMDESTGCLRVQCCLEKDRSTGFVTIIAVREGITSTFVDHVRDFRQTK